MASKNKVASKPGHKMIAKNKHARREFEIISTHEAGLVLVGSEVKSIKNGQVRLNEAFAVFNHGELFLQNCHVAEYPQAGKFNHDPIRHRKLLMHRRELDRLYGQVKELGLALVPMALYLKNGRIKIEIGLGKGKKTHDKRQDLKARDAQREMARHK